MSKRRRGKIVQLEDGRVGQYFYDEKDVNGKLPIHVFPADLQKDLFGNPDFKNQTDPVKLLVDPKKLKLIGFFD